MGVGLGLGLREQRDLAVVTLTPTPTPTPTQVVLLYGNRSPKDILLKDELDAMATKAAGQGLTIRLGQGQG